MEIDDRHKALSVHVVIYRLKEIKDSCDLQEYDRHIEALKKDDAYREVRRIAKHERYPVWLKKGIDYWHRNHAADNPEHWRTVTGDETEFLRAPGIRQLKVLKLRNI